jgi:formylglycine-generating enzyme required for sulfatase activity
MVRIADQPEEEALTTEFVGVGQTLARRFQLVREVARGGMGVVFEAEDTMLDGRRVAVKLLPAELASNKAARTRLKREALAAIDLTHKNITRLHSYEEDGPHAFLVMELLSGQTLEDELADRGPLPWEEVLGVARAATEAIALAHEQGVIHRDLKPANLMYSSVGDDRVLKVMDFGIAFRIRESLTRLTGQVAAGTLLYCPPEQLRNERASALSDQYSLAATLYELLSGEPPFPPPGVEHKLLNVEPHPLEDIPEHADRAIRTALGKHPEERFPDVEAFLAALEGEREVPEPSSTRLARAPTAALEQPPLPAPPAPSRAPWLIAGVSLLVAAGASLRPPTDTPASTPTPAPPATPLPAASPAPLTWARVALPPAELGERVATSVGAELAWVAPGRFRMGSEEDDPAAYENQQPARDVEVRTGFYLGRYEVTQAQFTQVMGYNPSRFRGDERPVESVIWNDARRFCQELTDRERAAGRLPEGWEYRLPTEAQWEYACRAGSTELHYGEDLDAVAWYTGNSDGQTQFVGKKDPNAWGFHDMLGNVWEYTQDRWHDSLLGAPADERPWDDGATHLRAIRGSSWGDPERSLQAASRGRPFWGTQPERMGFRLALVPSDLPTAPPEVTVRIRSTPIGAWVERPGLEGTLGRVGVVEHPLRISLPLGRHPFEFKVFNRARRRLHLELREEHLGGEVGLWAVLDEDPDVEGSSEERLEAELKVAQAETALALAPEDDEEAAGNRLALAKQTLERVTRGAERRVPVVVTSTPSGMLENLDRWDETSRMDHTWKRKRYLLEPGVYTFRITRRKEKGEPLYLPRVFEAEVRGDQELTLHAGLEPRPETPQGSKAGETRHNCVGMRLAWAPGTDPQRGLWVGAFEVTRSEYQRVMGEVVDVRAPFRVPVDGLTREQAQEFCRRLTTRDREEGFLAEGWAYRLPSEAEWEHARDAGVAGLMREQLPGLAWLAANAEGAPHQVGTRQPNGWGVYDVIGNVAEWCRDGEGVLRGGSFRSDADTVLAGAREDDPGATGGLRVVLAGP